MNLKNLKEAEKRFLKLYPGGFSNPEIVEIGKKHKMSKMTEFVKTNFKKSCFEDERQLLDDMVKLVARSSMVSVFEKPKFRDMVKAMGPKDKRILVQALYDLLHGKEKTGFEELVHLLKKKKMAKWTLTTVLPAYYRPQKDLLVKPTTTKMIIEHLELDLKYHPTPTWEFYRDYRKIINKIKGSVKQSLSPSNPAFCGFLMMSLDD